MANRLDGKGSARLVRVAKRQEAENRNSATPDDKRRSFWRARGFSRQSQAASLVTSTVADCNERAEANKQRSQDWPLLPENLIEDSLKA